MTEPHVDYVVNGNVYEVYTADGLAKYAYMVNYVDNGLCLELKDDIQLPLFEIVADHQKQTYVYTDVRVTVENGVPSGTNWISLGEYDTRDHEAKNYYHGWINGNGFTISGLRINKTTPVAGFVGYADTETVLIKDLNMDDAVVYNTAAYTGILAGWTGDGVVIKNCHLTNVHAKGGSSYVGGITAYSVTRGQVGNGMTNIIEGCSIDEASTVTGTGCVGGIAGRNYGSILKTSLNKARVHGVANVGGIAGHSRDYTKEKDGWVIACVNEGVVSGTNNVGGVVGYSEEDNNHTNAESYLVACSTTASQADYTNIIVGNVVRCVSNFGSWGLKTKASQTPLSAGTYTACYAYDSAADITQADVDAMNAAIDEYNNGRASDDPTYCAYKWAWTDGTLPVLQLQ